MTGVAVEDQGIMFGHAINEQLPELLSISFSMATKFLRILQKHSSRIFRADVKQRSALIMKPARLALSYAVSSIALILIPVFIYDFLCIHPFNDGNERMSRLLTTLLLYRTGYVIGKFTKSDIMEPCPTIGKTPVESSIKGLVDRGVLVKHGAGRSTFYTRSDAQ